MLVWMCVSGLRREFGSAGMLVPSSMATYNTCTIAEQAVDPWGKWTSYTSLLLFCDLLHISWRLSLQLKHTEACAFGASFWASDMWTVVWDTGEHCVGKL